MADLKSLTINDVTYDNFPFVVKVDTANGTASHTPAEIQAAAEEGRTVLVDFGGGSSGYILSRSATSVICIHSYHFGTVAYVTGYKIDADKKVTETASYTFENIPEAQAADNGKILKVVEGVPVWDSDYDLPVGGDELGGVKNGGNVFISKNEGGAMYAPELSVDRFSSDSETGVEISISHMTDEGAMDVEIVHVYDGKDGHSGPAGEAGGYYTPAVTQPDDETIQFDFTPSKEGMPAVAAAQVKLPVSTGTGAEEVVISSEEPTDENAKIWINPDEEDEASGSSGGGVSSWNDLTDKPFYSVEILPETMVEIDADSGFGVIPSEFQLETGKKYAVTYNGTEYVTLCVEVASGDVTTLSLGNVGALEGSGYSNTGEPFALMYAPVEYDENEQPISWAWIVAAFDGSVTVTVTLSLSEVEQIPEKYVPKQCASLTVDAGESTTAFITMDTTELVDAILNDKMIYVNLKSKNDTHSVERLIGIPSYWAGATLDDRMVTVKDFIHSILSSGKYNVSNIPLNITVNSPNMGSWVNITINPLS